MKNTFEYIAEYDLLEEPVFLPAEDGEVSSDVTSVSANGNIYPATPVCGGLLAVISAKKGEKLIFTAGYDDCGMCKSEIDADNHKVGLTIASHHFADYVYDTTFCKPHLGPITDNLGNFFTRCDRMNPEHPHQRSLIVAIGEVNDIDCWNEPETCGYVRTQKIYDVVSSSAYAGFTAHNCWTDHDGKPAMNEDTRFIVYNQNEDCRILDMRITFTADYGDVVFGPTKEAGPLGIRVRDELRADKGSGVIYNSHGAIGEPECWGKEADWCDYHGNIDGIGEMGITAFDCPTNERYPTAWHVRAYGLFAANNFYFKGGFTLKSGENITYHYRILFRRREMTADEISDRFKTYADQNLNL